MRHRLLVSLLVLAAVSAAGAQPKYGDLVIATGHGLGSLQSGYTGYLDPARPGIFTTLATAPTGSFHNWVRMAPNNTDLVLTRASWNTIPYSGELVNLQPNGVQSTIAVLSRFHTDGYELDHDGKWVLSARSVPLTPKPNYVLGVDHLTGAVSTFASLFTTTWFNEMAIDRDPGCMPYTIVCCCLSGTSGPEVVKADRNGTIVTALSSAVIPPNTAIELHPRSGDYIIGYISNGDIIRMTKTGTKTTLTAFSGNAIKILQDDTAWMANGGWIPRTILRYDLSRNAVLSLFVAPIPYGWNLMGIDVYGSRTLVCNQNSSSKVTVSVQSRHPSAGPTTQYALAASLARRPGVRFPHGEWLDLNTASDPLFYATALNALPSLFQNFRGTLDSRGNNIKPIQVSIPARLVGSGIPVFVAGVIFNQAGVFEVTNTHWFVL